MANYANAKATIAANIYTNHLGRVTAEMVKTAANEIVNTLIAGGYLYAGIAHPGDAAVSPDANVFYIATEAGTYTNKGGLVVADGEVAIFKWNGSWSKEVTGAATTAQVTELGQEIDVIESDINDSFLLPQIQGKFIPLAFSIGTVVDVNNPTVNSSYNYTLFPVQKDDVVNLNGSGGNDPRLYGILDSTYHLLQVASANASASNQRLVMPENSAYLIINTKNNADYPSYIYRQNSVYRMAEFAYNTVVGVSKSAIVNEYIKNLYIQNDSYSGDVKDLKVRWIQRADNVVTIQFRDTTLSESYNVSGTAPVFEFSRSEGFSGICIVDISKLPNNTQILCNNAELNLCAFDKNIKAAFLAYAVKDGVVGYGNLSDNLKKRLGSFTDFIGYESITNFNEGKYISVGTTIGAIISLTPVSNSGYEYQIVDVAPGEQYIIRSKGGNDPKAYGIIDSENKLLEYSLASDRIEDKSRITIPANGAKLIVNSQPTFLSYVLKVVDEVPFLYNPWFGKKVAVLGASHTAAANSWADHAAKLLGFNLYKRAIGGSGVLASTQYCAILPDGTYIARVGNPSSITSLSDLRTYMQGSGYNATEFTECTYTEYRENPGGYNVTDTDWFVIASKGNAQDRIHTLPQDSEIVVIQFGANDTGRIKGLTNPTGMEMGNVDDYDVSLTDTYYANYKNMLQKIMAWCTNIKRIILLIPDDSTACYVSNTDMTRTDWGKDHDAVKDAIRNLALVYGYEKVEFKNILNYFTVYTLTSDGTHPTAECQKLLGEYFANNALNKL